MKSLNLMAIVAIVLLAACKNNDDNKSAANQVEGVYTGIFVSGVKMPTDTVESSVKLTAQTDNRLTVMLPKGKQGGKMSMPEIELKNVIVEQINDSTFNLSIDKIDVPANNINFTGNLNQAKVQGNDILLKYSLKPGEMPVAIECVFKGKR